MEAKLDEHVASGEFYAAHQLLLSLGQRHQRAGRWSRSLGILCEGLVKIAKADGAPRPTIEDLAGKIVQVVGEQQAEAVVQVKNASNALSKDSINAPSKESIDFAALLGPVWEQLLVLEDEDQFWLEWSGQLTGAIRFRAVWSDLVLSTLYPTALKHLKNENDYKVLLEWLLADCMAVPAVFKDLKGILSTPNLYGRAVLQLIRARAFASAAALIQVATEQLKTERGMVPVSIEDGSGTLPSFLALFPENDQDLLVRLVNLSQLLFLLCQRAQPSPQALGFLEERYGRDLLEGDLEEQFALLKAQYWPKRNPNPPPANGLAALLQGMMGGGGGNPFGGQSGGQSKKKSSSQQRIDLD